ncbi:MAG: hypothetical protein V1904_12875 [Bacteroidota bacterium]
MKKILYIIFSIFPFFCIAQKQGNIWYFGDHAGLDFNTGAPVVLTNGQTYQAGSINCPIEGTAVICDSTGALLFYTNGQKIWNKNHQVMPNGDNLLGNYSSTQAALIVPLPGTSRYFYVFTTDDFCEDNLQYGFRYSIVDICQDNGFGDIMIDKKNIKLLDTVAEKLTAVSHANGIDYWIITHKYYSDAFYSYHLSSIGIVDTVISHVGSIHPAGLQNSGQAIGYLKASPNGQKLAIVNGNSNYSIAEYFDFNKTTGIVSNGVSIQTNPLYNYYGISFSPDNSKFYIACWLNNNGIYQFNLQAGGGNPDSVKASKISIISGTHYAMQLATNGKIYVARMASGNQYIGVINNPNDLGLACNLIDSAIYLDGKFCGMGFPNFIDSYDYSNATYKCPDTTEIVNEHENKNNAVLYQNEPNPFDNNTVIRYYIPEGTIGDAFILFSDMYGNEIKKEDITVKGFNNIKANTENLASGIYSYSLIIDGNVMDTKKMIRKK